MGSQGVDWSKFKLPGQQPQPKPPETQSTPEQPAQATGGIDWKKFQLPGQQPTAERTTTEGLDWSKFDTGKAKPKAREDDPGFFFRSIAKSAMGKSASDLYDQYVAKGILPKERQGDWGTRFMVELARGGPEMIDAATSPAGAVLIGAHIAPMTRPVAMIADSVLGLVQAGRTIPSLWKMGKDFTPENAAIAAKDVLYTYWLIRGSQKGLKEVGARDSSRVARAREGLAKLEEIKPVKGEKKPVRLAKEAQRQDIWNELIQPANSYEKLLQKAYASRFSGVAKLLLPRPTDIEVGAQLVDEYQTNMNVAKRAKDRFTAEMQREVPAEDLTIEKMGYAIQKAEDVQDLGISKTGEQWIEKYREFERNTAKYIKDAYGDIPVVLQDPETYLSQIWDLDKTAELTGKDPRQQKWFGTVSRRMMRDPFMKARRAMSKGDGPWNYKEGIEDFGWVPKFKTVPEVINHRWDYMIQTAENQRLARRMRQIGAIIGDSKARKIGSSWPRAEDATPLYRAAYAGTKKGSGVVSRGPRKGAPKPNEVSTQMRPVFVHPAIKHAVDTIFSSGFKFTEDMGGGRRRMTILGSLENLRAWAKQSSTMTSMFHNWAEMSQSMAVQVGQLRPGKAIKSIFIADPEYWRYLKGSIFESFGKRAEGGNPVHLPLNPDAIMKWVSRGQEFTSTDREEAVIKWMREFQGRNKVTKATAPILHTFGNIAHGFNKALWDYYIPGQMLNASESILTRELPRLGPDATPEKIAALEREIAKHTNRVFGTESLQSLLLHPKSRQLLSALIFAPVWTASNVRIITAGYESETQQRLRNKWAVGAALSWFISTQLMNYATTSWFSRDKNGNHDWKGHWTWQNPGAPIDFFGRSAADLTDNTTRVYIGPNEDQSEGYVSLGKGLSEIFGWMLDPRKEGLGKMSQPLKVGITLGTGRAPGSDYQAIGYGKDRPDEIKVEQVSEILSLGAPFWTESFKRLLEHKLAPEAVPEGAPTSFLSLPARRGLTVTRATEAYQLAKERGDTEVMKAVLEAARKNHLRVNTIISNVRRTATQRRRTEKGPRNQINWKQRMGFEPIKTAEPPSIEATP